MPAPKYRPGRGGHAPEWMREAFENGVQDHIIPTKIIGKLWCCADTMPSSLREALDVPRGASYARGAREAKAMLRMGLIKPSP